MYQQNPKAKEIASKRNKIILFFALIFFLTGAFAVKKFFYAESAFDKQLKLLSTEINKTTPILVDQNTRLDRTETKRGEVFLYHYTLVNMEKGSFEEEELREFLRNQILDNIKNNPDLQYFRDHGAAMTYTYKDKNSNYLFDLTFNAEDYR
ncbi:hypothetical protein MMU07_19640 [Aquiflexum sp. LQ15W]|uniref:hypothetical protein n=1 Tax=Cognataquiflexum nitidum TaxID=2922272 RepID=UPI001F12F2C5|nr:hypothetical protein [Cognataquiflexum nitidum]MCH6201803.1 hypothetical protein [Cognataquiflexum nitidum]